MLVLYSSTPYLTVIFWETTTELIYFDEKLYNAKAVKILSYKTKQ